MSAWRQAVRSLWQSPVFALTVVLTLGMGVGLTDAIFTVVDSVLLRPLGYRDADRIVALETRQVGDGKVLNWIGGDDYVDLTQQVRGLEQTAYFSGAGEAGVRVHGQAEYVAIAGVSPGFGQVLGVEPVAGRLFDPRDGSAGGESVRGALVSSAFARAYFGSDAAALGQPVEAEQMLRVIVGVLPAGFSFPDRTAVWLELEPHPANGSRSAGNQSAIGRRREGVSASALQAELSVFSKRLGASYPEDRGKTIEAVPLQQQITGPIKGTLRLLMGSVLVVLLIVCVNLAHMQLARGTRRVRAASVRTALGASRWRLAKDALAESLVLAAAGAVLAMGFAWPALQALLRLAPPGMPRLAEIRPSVGVFLFSLLVSAGIMTLAAMLPLAEVWKVNTASLLRRDDARGGESRGTRRVRSTLLVTEIAFTLVLTVSALLLVRQLLVQSRAELGFRADQLLTLDVHVTGVPALPDPPAEMTPASMAAYRTVAGGIAQGWETRLNAVLQTVRAVPGVTSAAAIEGAPMGFGAVDVRYAVRGEDSLSEASARALPVAYVHAVSPSLFQTLHVPVVRGRGFGKADRLGGPSVAVISAAMTRQRFPGQDPIGRQIRSGYDFDDSWWTVVGVVGDIRAEAPGVEPVPTVYVPLAQHPQKSTELQVLVRTPEDAGGLATTLSRTLQMKFPEVAVRTSTMRENIAGTERFDRLRTTVFEAFGVVSLLLAALGIYGVTAYSVAQRRFEFGLRLAVGASRSHLLFLVLGRTLVLATVGIAIGGLASLGALRFLSTALGRLPAFDPDAYALAVLTVMGLAVLAALMPAHRASRTQPMQVLRNK